MTFFFHLGCPGKISSSQTWRTRRSKQHVRVTDLLIVIRKFSACVVDLASAWEGGNPQWLPLPLLLGKLLQKKKDTGEFIVGLSE